MRLPRSALLLALLLGCEQPPAPQPPPQPSAPVAPTAPATPDAPPAPPFPAGWPNNAARVTAAHGMVVTDAALATRVGVDILKAGGNAVDAAVATAFALAVVYPGAGNLGGGGFLVARVDGVPHSLDFRERAPLSSSHDMYKAKAEGGHDGGPSPQTPGGNSRLGHLAAGVPGSVAGLWEAFYKLGSRQLTWGELLAPAIRLAEQGFTVDAAFAKSVTDNHERLEKYPASAALFLPGGAPLKEGTTWKNPELAATLRRISEKGPPGFYEGPTAEMLAAEMKRGGGLVTLADLAEYRAKWRPPVLFKYRGLDVISMAPPSSGGVTLAMMAHILEGYDLSKLAFHSPEELHLIFEAMRRAFVARNERLGDPDFVENPTARLLSPQWAAEQRSTIKPDRATPTAELPSAAPMNGGAGPHTTNFSVVDAKGNAVALTTTLNWFYGAGVAVPGAGFVLNNEMDDFATVPGTANGFGLVQGEPNAVAPGKRMLSSMSPSIVLGADGHVKLVLGAAGGPTITTSVFLQLAAVADHGLDVAAAVSAPRFHEQGQPDVVTNEKGGLPDPERKALEAMGYTFKEREHIADAPAIGWSAGSAGGSGTWIGAAEPRRLGSLALGY
jgi:gamma-glutamyltranspeptidase/glutathione hydrolase